MKPLPCNLAVVFLYENPGQFFSECALKIAADVILGVLSLVRLFFVIGFCLPTNY